MSVSYENLWKLLAEKGLKRVDLCEKAGITTNTLAKLGKNESVQVEVLSKICGVLECSFDDIISNTGDNAIISPVPSFKFYDINTYEYDIFEYDIMKEYEILNIQTLNDFPKPHTISNIKKTLTKYIKECKLSIKAVEALLKELKKYNITIVIDEKIVPEYERIPKTWFAEDEHDFTDRIEYQQAKNYLDWIISKKSVKERLEPTFSTHKHINDNAEICSSYELPQLIGIPEYKIQYQTGIEIANDSKAEYPFNLLNAIFGERESCYYKHQRKNIEIEVEKILLTLTEDEQTIIKKIFIDSLTIEDLYDSLGISADNELLKKTFINCYYKKALRKLRHPSRSKYLKDFTFWPDDTVISTNKLSWYLSNIFDNTKIIESISSIIDFDYILSMYYSEKTEFNTYLIITETLYNDNLFFHMFSLDTLNTVIKVEESETVKETIKSIIDECNNRDLELNKNLYKEITLDELDLSVRSYECLRRAKIFTLDNIVEKTEDDLMRVRNLGKKCLEEILKKAQEYDYYLNNEGVFIYKGLDDFAISETNFSRYYLRLYSRNRPDEEQFLRNKFFERCTKLGYTLNGADWFIEMFFETTHSLNDINVIDKINNSQLLGSIILKKWRHITHWSSDSLLSKENRIWFIVAFNRLYQIGLEKTKKNSNKKQPLV